MHRHHQQPRPRTVPSNTVIIDASGVVHSVPTTTPGHRASARDLNRFVRELKESK